MAAIFDHERLAGIALQIGQRLDEDFGFGEQVGHFRGIGHRYHPAFFASRLRPRATRPVMTKGMTSTDSATLASIWPPIRLAIGNKPLKAIGKNSKEQTIWPSALPISPKTEWRREVNVGV